MSMSTKTRAFTAKFGFIAQRDMDDAAFPAIHRVEPERLGCVLHLFSGGIRAETQFRNAKHPEIVGIERKPRMVVIRDP